MARQTDARIIISDAEHDRHAGAAVRTIFGKINCAQKVRVVHACRRPRTRTRRDAHVVAAA